MTGAAAPIRRAVIIGVGSELLTPTKADTNSLFLAGALGELGVTLAYKVIVGDEETDVCEAVQRAVSEADIVLLTGGLGPTTDDVTRAAVCRAFDLSLEEDAAIVASIEARFFERGLSMPAVNRRQALIPRGAAVLPNGHGTAPGLWIETGACVCVALPGPPRELRPMFRDEVAPRLAPRTAGARVYRQVLRVVGPTESQLEERVAPIYTRWEPPQGSVQTTILASLGQIELQLATTAATETDARGVLAAASAELEAVLGADLVSASGETLEAVVGGLLRASGRRVAVAESCTGGLVLSRLTDVPGSSDYVHGGWAVYSNQAKLDALGLEPALIRRHGAVSERVACAMAEAARRLGGVDYGLGITGIAGPGGGTPEKPVGTVWIALADPSPAVRGQRYRFTGERDRVKFQASQRALDMLRRSLLATQGSTRAGCGA